MGSWAQIGVMPQEANGRLVLFGKKTLYRIANLIDAVFYASRNSLFLLSNYEDK